MGKHWNDGYWIFENNPSLVLVVKDEKVSFTNAAYHDYPDEDIPPTADGTWEFGMFDECPEEIKELSGATHYNLKMVAMEGKLTLQMVLDGEGKSLVSTAFDSQGIEKGRWVSKEELKEIGEKRESCLTPSTVYKIQPEVQGKLLFLSGPPGSGKSTSGLLLAKNAGYVYYEADCFANLTNPYLSLDVKEPSVAFPRQPPLKDFSLETVKSVAVAFKNIKSMAEGKEYDEESIKQFYMNMATHVKQEKERIGGLNWVVAQAVPHRWLRDYMKQIMGPDCIFVVLSLSDETQAKRVEKRYANFDEGMKKWVTQFLQDAAKQYDKAGEDEENAVNVLITPDDNEQDVIEKILTAVKPYLSKV